ncbi:MAG TPA: imidazole glycerol phosphate synthase subunit HisH [Burkholderiales bacterium]|nr:imidazole glycerol phosphate synthase subunit HisH [Burkholderiales bacterium]
MIAIVDYGLGNVDAFATIYKRLNIPATLATGPADIERAERVILPGVGAFDRAMTRLNDSGMRAALDHAVLRGGKPVLGVCVGMQMMAERSEEGVLPGLGWIAGQVKRFDCNGARGLMPLPHMGWNDVQPLRGEGLFRGLESAARFYFLHSYYFAAAEREHVLATTDYACAFASSVGSGRIFGVQFHPEKSHGWGTQLLKNFAEV